MLVNPLVSIVVPNYNHAKYLSQRLDSVFNQTYKNFEVILLDDLSRDNSIEILDSYQDESITHRIYNKENSGSTFKQWKKGLEVAKGELVWIAESDDWAEVTFLEKMVQAFLENENVVLVYTDLCNVDENGYELGEGLHYNYDAFGKENYYEKGVEYIKNFMLIGNSIVNASGVVFKKELGIKHIDKVLNYRMAGDWLFWNNLLLEENAHVYFRGKEKLNYFRHSLQSTRNYLTIEKKERGLIEKVDVIFFTIKMLELENEKLEVKKREMLDWWSKDHSIKEALRDSFRSVLTTEMFQDVNAISLYKHYIKYKIKNISLIKALRI
ncbi:glycosyltransferase family 2 protein [Empedobacter brevis]|uniref:Glycosyltransferase family 2 protein n=1 Tax=Empedobacter brevis TaxID=247 RepID=A0AAJ1QFI4_9FLAO|nr:glycosyltransferase family 2 protein [Empedobacter brevis]MDM1073044.1 glycosyltransferase family 2 protein [Empedobacter brevis]